MTWLYIPQGPSEKNCRQHGRRRDDQPIDRLLRRLRLIGTKIREDKIQARSGGQATRFGQLCAINFKLLPTAARPPQHGRRRMTTIRM
jgi:hypothetical protein